jgi:co-chaperonin GroES (HSP10)
MTKVRPGFDQVLMIEDQKSEQTKGGIYLPNGVTLNQVRGKVVEIGPISEFKGDVTKISNGDTIIVSQYSGATFEIDGTTYRSVPVKDVIAVLNEE